MLLTFVFAIPRRSWIADWCRAAIGQLISCLILKKEPGSTPRALFLRRCNSSVSDVEEDNESRRGARGDGGVKFEPSMGEDMRMGPIRSLRTGEYGVADLELLAGVSMGGGEVIGVLCFATEDRGSGRKTNSSLEENS